MSIGAAAGAVGLLLGGAAWLAPVHREELAASPVEKVCLPCPDLVCAEAPVCGPCVCEAVACPPPAACIKADVEVRSAPEPAGSHAAGVAAAAVGGAVAVGAPFAAAARRNDAPIPDDVWDEDEIYGDHLGSTQRKQASCRK